MLAHLLDFRLRYTGAQPQITDHINLLPAEILGLVFVHLPLADRIRIALVCKAWRGIALDHAELWCDLDNINTRVLPHLLARTKQAPIRLAIKALPDSVAPFPSRHIAPHIGHIVSLDLRFPRYGKRSVVNILQYLFEHPAHMLETLCITLEGFKLLIKSPLFGGVAPRLRTLRLEGLDIDYPDQIDSNGTSATMQVTSFRAPGILHMSRGRSRYAAYTTAWARLFPALRELHLSALRETRGICSPEYGFPSHLTTLVLEFTVQEQAYSFDEPFKLLELANFTALRELTLVNAHPLLVSRVLAHVDSAVSLSLLGQGRTPDSQPGAHLRLTTARGAALNFLAVRPLQSLDDLLLQRSNIFSGLKELRIDDGTLYAFHSATIAHLCLWAPEIATFAVSLYAGDRTAPRPFNDGSAAGVLDHFWWGVHVLSLRNLRELRFECPGAGVKVMTDDIARFIDGALKLSSGSLVGRLVIRGVEVVDVRRECGISAHHLGELLQSWFTEIVYEPHAQLDPRPAQGSQRADAMIVELNEHVEFVDTDSAPAV